MSKNLESRKKKLLLNYTIYDEFVSATEWKWIMP